MNRVYYSAEPQTLLRLYDGSWLYRWDIESDDTEDGQRWSALQVPLHDTPTASSVTRAVITAMWPPDVEAALANDHAAAMAGLRPESHIEAYADFLAQRLAVKAAIREYFGVEPSSDPLPAHPSARWAAAWPLLAEHPDPSDIPVGGMAYRLAGDPITWWVVRQGDLESTQISAHDDAGEPIYRSRNLSTGVERAIHIGALERAANMALAPLLADLTPAEVLERISVFPEWRAGVPVTVGEHFRHDGTAYRVVQAHTTQADWQPQAVPALFAEVAPPDTIPDWVAPTGAHDTYQLGDQVRFEGQIWESTIDNNVWSPTAYPDGWKVVD